MKILLQLLLNAFVVFLAAYILPGVTVDGFLTALIVAVVLGVLNTVVKPILTILTLPITILTLGIFSIIINVLLILLATAIVPGFAVAGFWWALAFSIVVSIISSVLGSMDKQN